MVAIKGIVTTTGALRVTVRYYASKQRVIAEAKQWIKYHIDNGDEVVHDPYDWVRIYCDDGTEYLIYLDEGWS